MRLGTSSPLSHLTAEEWAKNQIALGADAAAVGRSMIPFLEKDGVSGVKEYIESVGKELRFVMSTTGFSKVSEIDESVLYEL